MRPSTVHYAKNIRRSFPERQHVFIEWYLGIGSREILANGQKQGAGPCRSKWVSSVPNSNCMCYTAHVRMSPSPLQLGLRRCMYVQCVPPPPRCPPEGCLSVRLAPDRFCIKFVFFPLWGTPPHNTHLWRVGGPGIPLGFQPHTTQMGSLGPAIPMGFSHHNTTGESGAPGIQWASKLKVHMQEILWFVFHNFLASFNNRQGRGPEFQKFC